MKSEMVKLEHKGLKFKMSRPRLAELAIASVFVSQTLPANAPATATVPPLAEAWPGQGGYNGGWVPARGEVPAHYLIIAKEDIGEHEWGGRAKESGATSKIDGLANSETLLEEGKHPAAEAAIAYAAEGHQDFYLPACAELYHCWVNVPELFAKDTWYWSSTQRSADNAFGQGFGVGGQDILGKVYELRVRPVRRLFI
ncbi:MAG: DUF1566 domain-containing protein [Pseudomonas sp.]|uniref:DUF1566 domain-containing protein n=1 Tax=Pseudomonas sp. TaxID=306 RepID=UPI003D6F3A47